MTSAYLQDKTGIPIGVTYNAAQQTDITQVPFLLFQSHRDDYYNMAEDCSKGIYQSDTTIIAHLFFSPANVRKINKMLKKAVFKATFGEYLIDQQEEKDLTVVMRSMYIQHAMHLKDDVKGQVKLLNKLTIDELVPNVISEIQAYYGYIQRAFEPRQIMDRPVNTSIAGSKTIPSTTKVFEMAADA